MLMYRSREHGIIIQLMIVIIIITIILILSKLGQYDHEDWGRGAGLRGNLLSPQLNHNDNDNDNDRNSTSTTTWKDVSRTDTDNVRRQLM